MKTTELRASHFPDIGSVQYVTRTDGAVFCVQLCDEVGERFYRVNCDVAAWRECRDYDTASTLRGIVKSINAAVIDVAVIEQHAAVIEEFPDFDTMMPVVKGFSNTSWHNDSAPSLSLFIGGYEARIWCDYADVSRRELLDAGPQFLLSVSCDNEGEIYAESASYLSGNVGEHLLSKIYVHWCDRQKLPASPMVGISPRSLSYAQRVWIENFMAVWMQVRA